MQTRQKYASKNKDFIDTSEQNRLPLLGSTSVQHWDIVTTPPSLADSRAPSSPTSRCFKVLGSWTLHPWSPRFVALQCLELFA